MRQDFVLNQSGNKPYNPEDYSLPVWRYEAIQMNKINMDETRKALQLLWDNININKIYQIQSYKWPEIKELLDQYYGIK